jgi:hypothetical protein
MLDRNLTRLTFDASAMDAHLKQRITPFEFGAIVLCIGMIVVFALVQDFPFDYGVYLRAARGDFSEYYYAHWLLPIFELFNLLPVRVGFILWDLLALVGLVFAIRVFGGSIYFALLNYITLYTFFYGQIAPIIVGLLALFWWSMAHRKLWLAGAAIFIAAGKFNLGLISGFYLWLLADLNGKDRFKILIIPGAGVALSLILYPGWPFTLVESINTPPLPDYRGNIALTHWLGSLAVILWLPVLGVLVLRQRVNFSNGHLFTLLSSVTMLTLPYSQSADLVILLVLPIGWLSLLGNLGFAFIWVEYAVLPFLAVIAGIIYLALLWLAFRGILKSRHHSADPGE